MRNSAVATVIVLMSSASGNAQSEALPEDAMQLRKYCNSNVFNLEDCISKNIIAYIRGDERSVFACILDHTVCEDVVELNGLSMEDNAPGKCQSKKISDYADSARLVSERIYSDVHIEAYENLITEPINICDIFFRFVELSYRNDGQFGGASMDCLATILHRELPEFMAFDDMGYPGAVHVECNFSESYRKSQ